MGKQFKSFNVKLILAIILAAILMFFFAEEVSANGTLESVHSEATVNEDGTVDIEQTWIYDDTKLKDGTEHYINLNASYGEIGIENGVETITDYEVYRNGEPMTFQENWSIDSSFEEKAGKYGIIDVGFNEVELTFGITERTLNEYTVKYKVHNVIKETTDGFKYLHWTFLPTDLDPNPSAMTAEVVVPNGVQIDKVYGFQYEGLVGFLGDEKERIFAELTGKYTSSSTLNVFTLFKDEGGAIKNTQPVDMTLEQKANEMLAGSDYDLEHFYEDHFETMNSVGEYKGPWYVQVFGFFFSSLIFIFNIIFSIIPALIGVIVIIAIIKSSPTIGLTGEMDAEDINKLKADKEFYYRDEPDEITYSSALVKQLVAAQRDDSNLISYYISKWASDEVFEYYEEVERGALIFKTKSIIFKLNKDKLNSESEFEDSLFKEFYKMTDENGFLDTRDLSKIDVKSISKLIKAHEKIAYVKLEELGYLVDKTDKEKNSSKKLLNFISFEPSKDLVLTNDGEDLVFQHAGLRNFLTQFTLINEREASEIQLWDYYFHMAALYGVADKFKKQLNDIPILTEEDIVRYNRYYGNTSTAALSNAVNSAVKSAYSSSNSGSRSSSSGGGGGSSGGGSGGGTR